MWQHTKNIFFLGEKDIVTLSRDKLMMILILFAFTFAVYFVGSGEPESVQNAPVYIVDEDQTQLSKRVSDAFLPPLFLRPKFVLRHQIDPAMDEGCCTFSIVFQSRFEKDTLNRNRPEVQLNVDATRMTQAFVGAGYISDIVSTEINNFVNRSSLASKEVARLDIRHRYNPNLTPSWHGAVKQLVNYVGMLSIILIGASLIGERESGTLEHLLVMPVVPFEIMCAKVWSMLVVVLIATFFSVTIVVQGFMDIPVEGSLFIYMIGIALVLFALNSMGIFLGCVAQNMPQLGMLLLLVLMPMIFLSGANTPLESMPKWVQNAMLVAPTRHFVEFSHQVLFRGAGWEVVWKPYLYLFGIGAVLFTVSLGKFQKSATQ